MKLKFLLINLFFAFTFILNAEERNTDVSFYTGTFDVIDKENYHKTSMFGVEHRDTNLFKNTFLGNGSKPLHFIHSIHF